MKLFLSVVLSLAILLPLPAFAIDQADMMKKIEDLTKQLETLKQQMQEIKKKETATDEKVAKVEKKTEEAKKPSWLEIGGDLRTRWDSLSGKTHDALVVTNFSPFSAAFLSGKDFKNDSIFLTRVGLNVNAKATEDITVKTRFLMYKVWGHETADPVGGASSGNAFFADKFFVFDGNLGHVPSDNALRVDQAYATWSNIGGVPVWFSAGRRPSTGGVPTNIRQNIERSGSGGVPGLLIDYAFDGATFGVAPDINALPGAYAKICYGKGFDSGFRPSNIPGVNDLKDVNFMGVNVVPYDTDNLHIEAQWSRAFSLFAFPENSTFLSTGIPNTNLGDIDQYGLLVIKRLENVGPGDLNLFLNGALSQTHPNNNLFAGAYGLLWDGDPSSGGKKDRTGYAAYVGARYDIKSTGTKIGAEYNYGSKNWITFAPASDDLWTGKLGTRGNVYEGYVIQEIKSKPISKLGKAQFRLGYQYYDFNYTGSNNWVGASYKIDNLASAPLAVPLMFQPLKNAHDVYLTFDVSF